MTGKKRGSQRGLLKNREDTKRQNTESLWGQVERLRKEKPDSLWSYKEIWSSAGLKSNVALDSPWNAHIKEAIVEHNRVVREGSEEEKVGQSQRKVLRTTNKMLRNEIERLKTERDKALGDNAIWEAEAAFYKRENARLQMQIERLRKATL